MNVIKFRGKNKQRGWIFGSYVEPTSGYGKIEPRGFHKAWIMREAFQQGGWFTAVQCLPVDEKTVGQLTLAQDENGRDIYEGDIVEYGGVLYEIKYIEKYMRFAPTRPGVVFAGFAFDHCRVVGNIHDNPELMEAAE